MAEMIDALYTRLVLRDFLGKVVPASLVVYSAYFAFVSETPPSLRIRALGEAPVVLWGALAAWGWLAGFAIQALGEKFKLIRYYPKRIDDEQFRKDLVEFGHIATDGEKQAHERYVVIKEACGNAYVSIFLAIIIVAIGLACARSFQPRWLGLPAVGIVAGLLL